MPKVVDHEERRSRLAAAVFAVIAHDGLGAVSLRNVATEAGVTTGMVQHYFATKADMVDHAMQFAARQFEERLSAALGGLDRDATASERVYTLLAALIPASAADRTAACVAVAFQSHATVHPDAAEQLRVGGERMCEALAEMVGSAHSSAPDPASIRRSALGLWGTAEGLATAVLTAGVAPDDARAALRAMVDRTLSVSGL